MTQTKLRNVAIIAHVDHGKTTLVDALLKQSGTLRDNQRVSERALDSNDQERERGITILSKCTSVVWRGVRINIVDTPGHADFGGEVERILSMVDGVLLLVDAAEGPMPQTKFVTMKALARGLRPIVVINKMDRPDSRARHAQNEIFDLFAALGANEEQLAFPTLFTSAKQGWAVEGPDAPRDSMDVLFETILSHVAPPAGDPDAPFAMLATTLETDPYLGRVLTGRIHAGTLRLNTMVKAIGRDGAVIEEARLTKLFAFRGLKREPVEEARVGDIVALAGLAQATVADTICAPEVTQPIEARPVDPPTLAMTFSINDSPLAGQEGDKVTSRMIRARLEREAEGNVAIHLSETAEKDAFEVAGRGELQLGVLIETMRRDGYEFNVSRPEIILRDIEGRRSEPVEDVVADVPEAFTGSVMEKLASRKGRLISLEHRDDRARLEFVVPSRGLFGYRGEFLTDTRGEGILYRSVEGFEPVAGDLPGRGVGPLVCTEQGRTTPHSIFKIQERAMLFVPPGVDVYEGQIVGESRRQGDLNVNLTRAKKLDNMRASGRDENVIITPYKKLTIEEALGWIEDDELLEVTPKSLRLRKRVLTADGRKKLARVK